MKTFRTLWTDSCRAFYAPRSLYRDIRDGRSTPSWLCVFVYCLIYVAGALWLYFNGFQPFVEPWIMLDPEVYYLVEAVYLTPLILLMWILGAGLIHVLGRLFGGEGRFDVTLRMTGYSLWAPWYPLAIVDSIHATPEWLYMTVLTVCVVLILVGTTISIRIEQGIGVVAALVVSVTSFVSIGGLIFTFIR